jgi:hypothetical protein
LSNGTKATRRDFRTATHHSVHWDAHRRLSEPLSIMSSEPTTAPAPAAEIVEKKEDATTTGAEGEAPAAGAADADAAAEKAGDKEGEPATEVEKSDAPPKVAETVEGTCLPIINRLVSRDRANTAHC